MLHKAKPFPFIDAGHPLFGLTQTCSFVLAANWLMQGVRGMDNKELMFRVLLEGWLAAFVLALMPPHHGASVGLVVAFLVAHSLNFALNGQPWVCLRYCPFYRRSPAAIDSWLRRHVTRLQALGWLEEAACIGSHGLGQGTRTERSDIDLRLIFPAGEKSWLRVNLLLLWLRSAASIRAIPLDLYAYDTIDSLKRFDQSEPLLIICDRKGRLAQAFAHRRLSHA